jgi:hypothetical protein
LGLNELLDAKLIVKKIVEFIEPKKPKGIRKSVIVVYSTFIKTTKNFFEKKSKVHLNAMSLITMHLAGFYLEIKFAIFDDLNFIKLYNINVMQKLMKQLFELLEFTHSNTWDNSHSTGITQQSIKNNFFFSDLILYFYTLYFNNFFINFLFFSLKVFLKGFGI